MTGTLESLFFIDLQPDNRERFNISFERCWGRLKDTESDVGSPGD